MKSGQSGKRAVTLYGRNGLQAMKCLGLCLLFISGSLWGGAALEDSSKGWSPKIEFYNPTITLVLLEGPIQEALTKAKADYRIYENLQETHPKNRYHMLYREGNTYQLPLVRFPNEATASPESFKLGFVNFGPEDGFLVAANDQGQSFWAVRGAPAGPAAAECSLHNGLHHVRVDDLRALAPALGCAQFDERQIAEVLTAVTEEVLASMPGAPDRLVGNKQDGLILQMQGQVKRVWPLGSGNVSKEKDPKPKQGLEGQVQKIQGMLQTAVPSEFAPLQNAEVILPPSVQPKEVIPLPSPRTDPLPPGTGATGKAVLKPSVSEAKQLTQYVSELIDRFLADEKKPKTVDSFVESLPREFRENYAFMIRSESLQSGHAHDPRVLTQSRDSKTIISFNLTAPTIEAVEFNGTGFDFHHLEFRDGKAKYYKNPPVCQACHYGRPNWDAYSSWPGMLPFNKDKIYEGSEEEKGFKHLFSSLADTPIFRWLVPPKGVEVVRETPSGPVRDVRIQYDGREPEREIEREGVKIKQGGRYLILHHPDKTAAGEGQGSAMFDQLTRYNAVRVAKELAAHPNFKRFQYVTRAVLNGDIRKESDFGKYLPKTVLDRNNKHFGMNYMQLEKETARLRRTLPGIKAYQQKQALRGLILANAERQGKSLSERELNEKILRELMRRNPSGKGGTPSGIVDEEDYGSDQLITQLRYVLEPEGVRMNAWSLSPTSRSGTYTFGDNFDPYVKQLYRVLPQEYGEMLQRSSQGAYAPLSGKR